MNALNTFAKHSSRIKRRQAFLTHCHKKSTSNPVCTFFANAAKQSLTGYVVLPSTMPQYVFKTAPVSLLPDQTQPWMQYWPAKPLDGENISTGEVEGFEKGQKVILGGVAGSFDKVLYDTAAKK